MQEEIKELAEIAGMRTETLTLNGVQVVLASMSLNGRIEMEQTLGMLEEIGNTAAALRMMAYLMQKRAGGTKTIDEIGELIDEANMQDVHDAILRLGPRGKSGNGSTSPEPGNG